MNHKKYMLEILKNVLLFTFSLNIILFVIWKFDNEFSFASIFSLIFNAIILPIALIIIVNNINQKYNINWWYLNYLFLILCILLSVFFNLVNWVLSAEETGGFYGWHNIDKGTWMILNLEIMVSLTILGVGLIYNIIKSLSKYKN